MNTAAPELIALGDSDLILAREDDDIRGRTVRDSSGGEVGEVDDLLIDTQDERVRFLVVASGGFLGIGAEKSYIPVDAVVGVDEEDRLEAGEIDAVHRSPSNTRTAGPRMRTAERSGATSIRAVSA